MPGTFVFRPIEANLTHNTDIITKMNPYCSFILGNQRFSSAICSKGGKHPHWYDTIAIPVGNESIATVELMDKDRLTKDDVIGGCSINLLEIEAQGKVRNWYPLYYKHKPAGEILLETTYQGTQFGKQSQESAFSQKNDILLSQQQGHLYEQQRLSSGQQTGFYYGHNVNQQSDLFHEERHTDDTHRRFIEQSQVVEPHTFMKNVQVVETIPVQKQIEVLEPRRVLKDVEYTQAVPVMRQVEVVEMKHIMKNVETFEPQTFHKQVEVTEQFPVKRNVTVSEPITITKAVEFIEPVITTQTITKELREPIVIDQRVTQEVGPASVVGMHEETNIWRGERQYGDECQYVSQHHHASEFSEKERLLREQQRLSQQQNQKTTDTFYKETRNDKRFL